MTGPPEEEALLDSCVGLVYTLLTSDQATGGETLEERGSNEVKRSMLLADYARRSARLDERMKAQLDGLVVRSFARPRDARMWHELQDVRRQAPVDVAVITVLNVELEAVVRAFDGQPDRPLNNQPFYRAQVNMTARPQSPLSIVITCAARPYNVHIGMPVANVRNWYRPTALFLVGIAAGHPDTFELGDVAIPTSIEYYEPERLTPGGSTLRTEQARPADQGYRHGLYRYHQDKYDYAEQVAAFIADPPRHYPLPALPKDFLPTVRSEGIVLATGEKVIRDGAFLDSLRLRTGKVQISAADQESYGFADAAGPLPWYVFRGISDHGDPDQIEGWKYLATGMAALCLRDFLQHDYLPPGTGQF